MITEENQPTVYLAGGMENAKKLGAAWRAVLTPKLEAMGIKVLNPCLFEQEQLKGLKIRMLPEKFRGADGKIVRPKHWHQLKLAPRTSHLYKRFLRYMQNIIRYDMQVVAECTDFVVCHWTSETSKGAGTHSELAIAFISNVPVYTVLEEGVSMPAWAQGCTTEIFSTFDALVTKLSKVVPVSVDEDDDNVVVLKGKKV